ncbi:hypothetical protein B0J15DRAFT_572042 [Fusarium solani]|uniref:Uncharacterized protein n=1 Tax=Fusarium solani TaxID=169388 RepID=A0A9P9G7J6_FUSSL|nr:uncharacterized protein B0J15DRAFT_572042 [Fusarium solani]KAH7232627.1 hypothetical protein B0J15DRAFT_572042 [Fusarium solani]
MVSWSVQNAIPIQRKLSVGLAATQLRTAFLVVIMLIAICIIATLVRYALFYRRHSADLEASQVPDAKLGWMLHAKHVGEIGLAFPDRDLFKTAAYRTIKAPAATVRGLPRVYSVRTSDEKLASGSQSQVDQPSVLPVLSETGVSETPNTQGTENQAVSPTASPKDDAPRVGDEAANGQGARNKVKPTTQLDFTQTLI